MTSESPTNPAATILIVDDESANRKLLDVLLRSEGYITQRAASGEEALASIARSSPDLILLDIMMPGMDGLQVATALKTNSATANIPIIMVTALTEPGIRLASLNTGAEDFLTKPFDRFEVSLRVRNLLRLKLLSDLVRNQNDVLEQRLQARVADLQLFHSAMDATADGLFIVNRRTMGFVEVNATACTMFGYQRRALIELGPKALFQNGPCDLESHYDELIGGTDAAKLRESDLRRRDGSFFAGELQQHAQRCGADWIIVCIVRDISARKQATEALRVAAEQFRGLVEQSIAGMYMVQTGKFVYANPRFAEIFSYSSANDIVNLNALSVVSEADRALVGANLARLIAGTELKTHFRFSGLRRDGSTLDIEMHGAHATHGGKPAVIGLVQDISEKARAEEEIRQYVAELKSAFMSTVEVGMTLSEMRDPYTTGHERRVAEIAVAIGTELGFDERRQEGLRVAGHLHDVGKITIPAEILSKPTRLNPIEFMLIQGHPQASYDALKNVKFPWPVAEIALQHHERLDGSGYPRGLKGSEILLESRIMSVADVVDAMSSHRPYRPSLGMDSALAEIERGSGVIYDPLVAGACLKLFREKRFPIPA